MCTAFYISRQILRYEFFITQITKKNTFIFTRPVNPVFWCQRPIRKKSGKKNKGRFELKKRKNE